MLKQSKLAAGLVIAAAAAVGSASVALADGYAPKGKVVYEKPSDWSGVYFGVSSGYQWSSVDVSNVLAISSDHADTLIGAHLGVQHQFGTIVLGVEGNWLSSLRDGDGSSSACGSPPVLTPGGLNNCTARFNDVLTIGARVGYAAGHWMPYVTGGYANGGFDFRATTVPGVPVAAIATTEQAHTRLNGWYVGAGFEWIISPGWTAGVEYRHYDYDTNVTTAFSAPPATPLELVRFDATTDTLTARVSWKWGREPAAPPLK